jgi:hypothetical protein
MATHLQSRLTLSSTPFPLNYLSPSTSYLVYAWGLLSHQQIVFQFTKKHKHKLEVVYSIPHSKEIIKFIEIAINYITKLKYDDHGIIVLKEN